jgi:hypothetical protein
MSETRFHECAATHCKTSIPTRMLMCGKHWNKLPEGLKRAVWAHYTPGQEDDNSILPKDGYFEAVRAAVAFIDDAEAGGPLFR